MQASKVNCVSCGTLIEVEDEIKHLKCNACGASLMVHRGEGFIFLELAEHINQTNEEGESQNKAIIHEEAEAYKAKLESLKNELRVATGRLNTLQGDIDNIKWTKKQLRQKLDFPTRRYIGILLDNAKWEQDHIRNLQKSLHELETSHKPSAKLQKPERL